MTRPDPLLRFEQLARRARDDEPTQPCDVTAAVLTRVREATPTAPLARWSLEPGLLAAGGVALALTIGVTIVAAPWVGPLLDPMLSLLTLPTGAAP